MVGASTQLCLTPFVWYIRCLYNALASKGSSFLEFIGRHCRWCYVLCCGPKSLPVIHHSADYIFWYFWDLWTHACLFWIYKQSEKRSFENTVFKIWNLLTRFDWVCSWDIIADTTSLTPPRSILLQPALGAWEMLLFFSSSHGQTQ